MAKQKEIQVKLAALRERDENTSAMYHFKSHFDSGRYISSYSEFPRGTIGSAVGKLRTRNSFTFRGYANKGNE